MELPASIRVKLSSEAAGSVSLTPVVSQEMPLRELLGHVVGSVGKDEVRVREVLKRGTLVSEGARYRWDAIDADADSVLAVLGSFPDPQPDRTFSPAHCREITFIHTRGRATVSRDAGLKRRLLQPRSFWNPVMAAMEAAPPRYLRYNYRESADEYEWHLSAPHAAAIRDAARLLAPPGLRAAVRAWPLTRAVLLCER